MGAMYTDEQLRNLIVGRLKELGRTAIEVAVEGGLERNFLRDLIQGKKKSIKPQFFEKVAKALDWPVERLMKPQASSRIARRGGGPITAEVPEIDLRAGLSYAGGFAREVANVGEGGAIVSGDAIRATWGIPASFLREELGARPGRAHILPVRGDSMETAIFDGDRVIIDLDDVDPGQGGIFAVRDDNGSIIIKQVELIRGAELPTIRCTSRNVHYGPFELILQDPVMIIGRVACKITRL